MQNQGRKNLPADHPHPLTLGFGSKGHISTFAEHGHVAYHIKGNHECGNMISNILSVDPPPPPPPDPRDGVIRSKVFFSEHGHVAYQMKWNHEMQRHGTKCFTNRTPSPHDPRNGVKFNFVRTWSCCRSN